MAFTIAKVTTGISQPTVFGNMRVAVYNLTFDNSYPSNGESFTPADIGWHSFYHVSHGSILSGFGIEYDYTNKKFIVYDEGGVGDAPLTELGDGSSDVDTLVLRVMVFGN